MMRAALVVLLAGCGRVGFGALGDAGDGDAADVPGSRARIAIGNRHACAIVDGALFCWGGNAFGAVGIGSFTTDERVPVRVGPDADWQTVSTGDDHTCGLRAGGDLYCWGQNNDGELGVGPDLGNRSTPQLVGAGWTTIACKEDHCCALRTDGSIWGWGGNDAGELGTPGATVMRVPTQVSNGVGWQKIRVGFNYALATRDGVVNFWGADQEGQRGDGVVGGIDLPPANLSLGFNPIEITAGNEHNCATDGADALWCWGDNRTGQIGNGSTATDQPTPIVIAFPGPPSVISVGGYTSCAITRGELYCWGANVFGQLGIGSIGAGTERLVSTRVGTETDWIQIVVGQEIVCGTRPSGTYCWGANRTGSLGIGAATADSPDPLGPLVF